MSNNIYNSEPNEHKPYDVGNNYGASQSEKYHVLLITTGVPVQVRYYLALLVRAYVPTYTIRYVQTVIRPPSPNGEPYRVRGPNV